MTEHTQHPATLPKQPRDATNLPDPVYRDLETLSGDLNASDIEPMTDEEWELHNLEAACEHLGDAWSAVLRAMYRDTRQVPYQYALACREVRQALDTVRVMAKARRGE